MSESITDRVLPDESVASTTILAVIGFGMLLAVVVVAYVGNTLSPVLSAAEAMLCKGVCWAAFAAVHFLAFRGMADALFGFIGSGRLSIGIALCAAPLPAAAVAAGFGMGAPVALVAVFWLLFGLALSGVMLSWGTVWSTVGRRRAGGYTIAQLTAGALALAAVLCVFTLFAPPLVATVAAFALLLASLVLFRACHLRVAAATSQDKDGKVSGTEEGDREVAGYAKAAGIPEVADTAGLTGAVRQATQTTLPPSHRLLKRGVLTPLTRGIAFGVIFFYVIFGYPFPGSLALTIAGMALAGLVIILVLHKLKHVPKVPSVERATFPVLAATLLLTPFTGPTVHIALILIAVVALFYQFILNPDAISLRLEGAGAIYHCARENFVALLGVFVGWAGQTILSLVGVPLESALFALSLVLVFLMVVEPAFIPYMSYVAIEELASSLEGATDEGAGGKKDAARGNAAGSWKRRCAAICQEFGLSPRESEVFLLLAKGRNAEHISNELFISTHTVRTHMYRIYRKLSVNSQQELIDIVDRL